MMKNVRPLVKNDTSIKQWRILSTTLFLITIHLLPITQANAIEAHFSYDPSTIKVQSAALPEAQHNATPLESTMEKASKEPMMVSEPKKEEKKIVEIVEEPKKPERNILEKGYDIFIDDKLSVDVRLGSGTGFSIGWTPFSFAGIRYQNTKLKFNGTGTYRNSDDTNNLYNAIQNSNDISDADKEILLQSFPLTPEDTIIATGGISARTNSIHLELNPFFGLVKGFWFVIGRDYNDSGIGIVMETDARPMWIVRADGSITEVNLNGISRAALPSKTTYYGGSLRMGFGGKGMYGFIDGGVTSGKIVYTNDIPNSEIQEQVDNFLKKTTPILKYSVFLGLGYKF